MKRMVLFFTLISTSLNFQAGVFEVQPIKKFKGASVALSEDTEKSCSEYRKNIVLMGLKNPESWTEEMRVEMERPHVAQAECAASEVLSQDASSQAKEAFREGWLTAWRAEQKNYYKQIIPLRLLLAALVSKQCPSDPGDVYLFNLIKHDLEALDQMRSSVAW